MFLSQDHFGFHAVQKLLKYGEEDVRKQVLAEFSNHFKHISQHRDGHHVLEFLYSNEGMMKPDQKKIMLSEFYGPQFKVLKNLDGSVHTIHTIFANEGEGKQQAAMSTMRSYIDKMVSKRLTRVGVFHTILLQYFQYAHLSTIQELGDVCLSLWEDLWQSDDGSRVLMYIIAISSAKDRKAFIKGFSENLASMLQVPAGCNLLRFAFKVVDDTVLLRKQLIQPIAELLPSVIQSQHGRILIFHLLAPNAKRYFSKHDLEVIALPVLHYAEERDSLVVSKKDADLRKQEIIGDRVLSTILKHCVEDSEKLNEIIRNADSNGILIEALRLAKDSDYGLEALEKVAALVSSESGMFLLLFLF